MKNQDGDRPKSAKPTPNANLPQHDDTAIFHAAAEVLRWDVLASEQPVTARVKQGWITLSGLVDWQFQKNNAAADIGNLVGVVGVTNNIVVRSVAPPLPAE